MTFEFIHNQLFTVFRRQQRNPFKILMGNDFLPRILCLCKLPIKCGAESRRKTLSTRKDWENVPPAILRNRKIWNSGNGGCKPRTGVKGGPKIATLENSSPKWSRRLMWKLSVVGVGERGGTHLISTLYDGASEKKKKDGYTKKLRKQSKIIGNSRNKSKRLCMKGNGTT